MDGMIIDEKMQQWIKEEKRRVENKFSFYGDSLLAYVGWSVHIT